MTEPAFFAGTPVRFSHLRAYGRSPAHGRHARIAPKGDETLAMERGTAVHAILFGTKKVIGYPGATRRGKEYDAFVASHPDHEILSMKEYDKAMRMADAVIACDLATPLLQGVTEETLLFDWMGLKCRATPDVRGAGFLTELKTSQSSDPNKFLWHARRMHYHAQMRFQNIACGMTALDSYIVCVEAADPFPVTVFRIDEKALEVGEKLLMGWAECLKGAEASQVFSPYVSCIVPIDLPDNDDLDLVFPETETI